MKKQIKLKVYTPPVGRIDNRKVKVIPKSKEELDSIITTKTHEELIEIGLQKWESDKKGTLYLFPSEWYDSIPKDYPVSSIFEEKARFSKRKFPNDSRFGALLFGFTRKNKISKNAKS